MLKRKPRQDRNHAVYLLINQQTDESYIGITVCGQQVRKALKVRWQKHVRRALTEGRDWNLCKSIRDYGPESFDLQLLEVVRGRKPAHARERELIGELSPELNQY
jgi:hypothetical protein